MNNRQTPLEKLISDKERIQRQCKRQEQKLNEDFSYIQENVYCYPDYRLSFSRAISQRQKQTTRTQLP